MKKGIGKKVLAAIMCLLVSLQMLPFVAGAEGGADAGTSISSGTVSGQEDVSAGEEESSASAVGGEETAQPPAEGGETVSSLPEESGEASQPAGNSESSQPQEEGDQSTPSLINTILGIISPQDDKDKTDELKNVTLTVKQDDKEIGQDDKLNSKKPIKVNISFDVPVKGDDPIPDTPVQKGDTATFEISKAFKLPSDPDKQIELKTKDSVLVGHVTFSEDDEGMVIAHVVFDGKDEVFESDTISGVRAGFEVTFNYNGDGEDGEIGDHTIAILDKTYTVNVPAPVNEYKVTKTGNVDYSDKSIEWEVTLTATADGKAIDLKDYKFVDDLKDVGEYRPDSFTVGGTKKDAEYKEDKTLSYIFPENSQSPQKVTFKTAISDDAFYATSKTTVSNTAGLVKDDVTLETGSGSATITPKWIEKSGEASDVNNGNYNPKGRTITWTIIANHNAAKLDNVVITDKLPDGLTFDSATWQTEISSGVWSTPAKSITPENDEYAVGHIESKILLTIVTKVPDDDHTTGTKKFYNSASIRWDGMKGTAPGTGNIGVGIGYNAISKKGTLNAADRTVTWEVTVDPRGQSIPNMKVYDLLVYGDSKSGFDLTKATGFPAGLDTKVLTPKYDQKYIDNSFASGAANLVAAYPIFQDGKRVADLLEVNNFAANAASTFTFKTQVLNPNIFAGNKTGTVNNTATLFSGNAKLNEATTSVDYPSQTLDKKLLKREAMSDPAAGVNNFTDDATKGFDYKEKAAIFRLLVNRDGTNLSTAEYDAAGNKLGKITVTDTLPKGWEFVDITDGNKFLIFEGTAGNDPAASTTPTTVEKLATDFTGKTEDGKATATFTFDPLDKTYVILVKAKPTDDTLAEYFSKSQTLTVPNNLSMSAEKWKPGASVSQNVQIVSKVLDKNYLPGATGGTLLWTVDYKPYDLKNPGDAIEDTLPNGIDLRTDSKGNLLLGDGTTKYITVQEMTLKADGTYDIGNEVPLTVGKDVFYSINEKGERVLSFKIPDSSKAYRFNYLTDITGDPGNITNHVKLLGGSQEQESTGKSYAITSEDGWATLQRNGWLEITKTNSSGTLLPGAEFTLFAKDSNAVVKRGITGSDGKLKLKVIPNGEYTLRETKAPDGYSLGSKTYSVNVTTEGTTVTTSIDGGSKQITVKNFATGTGSLVISKTVAGDAGDKTKTFDFTVTFGTPEAPDNNVYSYFGTGVPDGTIKSGDTVSLTHGQSITIMGLPDTTAYTVTESNYSADGYSTAKTGDTGVIKANGIQTASFTNTKSSPGKPSNPSNPGNPGGGGGNPGGGTGKGYIVIQKSVEGDDALSGFTFEITDGKTYTERFVTDENGRIETGDLPAGTYTVREISAAGVTDKYVLPEAQTVHISGFGTKLSFVNKLRPEFIPDDGVPQGGVKPTEPIDTIPDNDVPKGTVETFGPKTGYTGASPLWALMLGLSLAGLGYSVISLLVSRKKGRHVDK
jgi:uncharacterized repeat protein (TIGR01451 family)